MRLVPLHFALLLMGPVCANENLPDKNPLARLPSSPGPHLEKLKALGDNQWLNLGCPAPDAKWCKDGVARGRSWCSKMAYAQDLGGAFFCGTGVHGFVKPDGCYMDDLWFYDVNAHKWICLYPGANTKTLKLKLDEHHFEVTQDGDPNPVSYLSHAYNMTTYIPKLRKYMLISRPCPWWTKALPQRADWLEVPMANRNNAYQGGKVNGSSKHPILWNVDSNKWEHPFVTDPTTPGESDCSMIEYLPGREQVFFLNRGGVYFYDFKGNKWINSGAKAGAKGYDSNGCLDAKQNRIYVAGGKSFWCFDVTANSWMEIKAEGQPQDFGCTNTACLFFDTANEVAVWHGRHGKIAVYIPATNKWETPPSTFPDKPVEYLSNQQGHGFYDQNQNVHYYYIAGDSSNKYVTMLAYRYKNTRK